MDENETVRLVECDFPQSCGRLLACGDDWARVAPDTPEGLPGNVQYYLLVRVRPSHQPLRIEIDWPQRTESELPGFYYPDNENFGSILHQACFISEDRSSWHSLPGDLTERGVRFVLKPSERSRYISVGIPYFPEDLTQLLESLRGNSSCRVERIGCSRLGRDLNGLFFGAETGYASRGMFLLQGYQHHTEWAGLHVLDALARGLADGSIPRGPFDWAIVPCLNVDALHGGWREDLMHVPSEEHGDGNFNRDWDTFQYPETRAARDFYEYLSQRNSFLHVLDLHMGWSSPQRSGGGLTIFKDGCLSNHHRKIENDFTQRFFANVAIEPFAWAVTDPERPNFASWVWRRFQSLGQTVEISRFQSLDESGQPGLVSKSYYRGLAPGIAETLRSFYEETSILQESIGEST
jgi:hypothetical protein